jgi:hypothetical protein
MIGSVTGTLIYFLGFAPKVAIISAVTAAISVWMEFHSTSQKLKRYNTMILGLKNVLLWWDSLNSVDKANPLKSTSLWRWRRSSTKSAVRGCRRRLSALQG